METNEAFEVETQEKDVSDVNADNGFGNKKLPGNNGDASVTGSHFKDIDLDDEVEVKINDKSNIDEENDDRKDPRFVLHVVTPCSVCAVPQC